MFSRVIGATRIPGLLIACIMLSGGALAATVLRARETALASVIALSLAVVVGICKTNTP